MNISIKIEDIRPRGDVVLRSLNAKRVSSLAESMKWLGLQHPIIVRPSRRFVSGIMQDAWQLVTGAHRVEAAKSLGWEEIEAKVVEASDDDAEAIMLDENLERAELEPAEFAYATRRRKALYEKLNPEAAHGAIGNGREKSRHYGDSSPPRFTAAIAETSGKSERAVQRAAFVGEVIGDDVMRFAGTKHDTVTGLEKIARGLKAVPANNRTAAVTEILERPACTIPPLAPQDEYEAFRTEMFGGLGLYRGLLTKFANASQEFKTRFRAECPDLPDGFEK